MSADNWAFCPNIEKHFPSTGNVAEQDETFREDYEIYGAETGMVVVTYSGACTVCKARLKFTERKMIEGYG